MGIQEALSILEAWERAGPSRSIETFVNAVGTITARANGPAPLMESGRTLPLALIDLAIEIERQLGASR